jgi:hypothetical protein
LSLGFRHDCTDYVLKLRAANFKRMKKLVKKDRLQNDEAAEPLRCGKEAQLAKEVEENSRLAMESGAVIDSSDGNDSDGSDEV